MKIKRVRPRPATESAASSGTLTNCQGPREDFTAPPTRPLRSPRAPRPGPRRTTRKFSAAAAAAGAEAGAPPNRRTRALPADPRRPRCAVPEARPSRPAANMAETSEEVAVLVQRVVKDITNAFRRNPHM